MERKSESYCQECGLVTIGLMTVGKKLKGKLGFYKLCVKCALGIDAKKERTRNIPPCQRVREFM